jgi:hypothetical protein
MEVVPPLTPDRSSFALGALNRLETQYPSVLFMTVHFCTCLRKTLRHTYFLASLSHDDGLKRSEDTVRGRTGMQSRLRWIPLLYTLGRSISH